MATPAKPLNIMTKLSPWVSYYNPPKTAGSATSGAVSAPKLILMASWMDAKDAHIAKYITYYQTIYPTSTVLLVKFTTNIAFTASRQNGAVQPAASYIRSQIDSGVLSAAPREPEILVHAFSNGGTSSMTKMYQIYRKKTGHPFPPHAAVYDSCPGRNSLFKTYYALAVGLKGIAWLFTAPLIVTVAALLSLLYGPLRFLFGEGPLRENQIVHNDRTLVRQTNRAYIYSKEDIMVDWRHVEGHAKEAAAKGIPVRKEMWTKSAHVAHMPNDSDRYWNIVTDTWEQAIKRSGTLLPGFT